MALAWKAGWVHALTSSNLVSSAIVIPALTWAGIFFSGVVGAQHHDSCPEYAPSFRDMFSSEHLSARAPSPLIRVTWGRTGSQTQAPAPRTMVRGAGEVDRWLPTRGADCAHGPVVE